MSSYHVPPGQGALETVDGLNHFIENNQDDGCIRARAILGRLCCCEECPFPDCKWDKSREYRLRRLE